MEREERNDGYTEIEDRFSGYTVYDRDYEKVGKVDDLFVDESDRPEYIGVKTGLFGMNSTLIPFELVRVND
ncbi:MAG: PRC-barrel domain-containing protein, partial [Actinomycetota bacterium]